MEQCTFKGFNESKLKPVKGFDAKLIFDKLIGTGINASNAFTYLFRRFGPTLLGYDSEHLHSWLFKHGSICLSVTISSPSDILVEVLAHENISNAYYEWFYAPAKAWHESFSKWAEEQQEGIYDAAFGALAQSEQQRLGKYLEADIQLWKSMKIDQDENWEMIMEKGKMCKAQVIEFFEWKKERVLSLKNEFVKENPFPIPSGEMEEIYQWHRNLHHESDWDVLYDWVESAIEDLLQPTVIGGYLFNINGVMQFDNQEAEKYSDTAYKNIYKHSGAGDVSVLVRNHDKWAEVIQQALQVSDNIEDALMQGMNELRKSKREKKEGIVKSSRKKR